MGFCLVYMVFCLSTGSVSVFKNDFHLHGMSDEAGGSTDQKNTSLIAVT